MNFVKGVTEGIGFGAGDRVPKLQANGSPAPGKDRHCAAALSKVMT